MKRNLPLQLLAGVVLGLPLSYALSGLFGFLAPGTLVDNYLVTLWLIFPIWFTVLTIGVAVRTGWRAWIYLSSATFVAFLILFFVRQAAYAA